MEDWDPHQPFHESSCHGPRMGPNILRPRMKAPKLSMALAGELIVDVADGSSLFGTVHGAEGVCVKEPLEDFGSAFAEWIIQALF